MAQQTIFYSWQSWTDGGANRNFIEDCLERAIKEIRKDDSLRLDPVIDRDTQGVPGAADIANTIFGKVAEADVFVADVSFVQEPGALRRTPNPNVLVELGYALSKLGEGISGRWRARKRRTSWTSPPASAKWLTPWSKASTSAGA